jgi:hypothetical protein
MENYFWGSSIDNKVRKTVVYTAKRNSYRDSYTWFNLLVIRVKTNSNSTGIVQHCILFSRTSGSTVRCEFTITISEHYEDGHEICPSVAVIIKQTSVVQIFFMHLVYTDYIGCHKSCSTRVSGTDYGGQL